MVAMLRLSHGCPCLRVANVEELLYRPFRYPDSEIQWCTLEETLTATSPHCSVKSRETKESRMKGFVETPKGFVDLMIKKLFTHDPPTAQDTILDPGCGKGAFIEGIIRWCKKRSVQIPNIVGVELDPRHILETRTKFARFPSINIEERNYLTPDDRTFDYVVGNPPYVPITQLSEEEKTQYRASYKTAKGRFDLYLLFFEQALRNLRSGGRLVFVTPEKFLYVDTASPLRELLAAIRVEEIRMVDEEPFGKLVTYPTITTITNLPSPCQTLIVLPNWTRTHTSLPATGESWLPTINGRRAKTSKHTLESTCLRISCGVATGADSVFVLRNEDLPAPLRRFAHPTIAGRELVQRVSELRTKHSMLIPYAHDGHLMKLEDLRPLVEYLSAPEIQDRLQRRTCVSRVRKPWYAFHENPPLSEILRAKILCKDLASHPRFWIDKKGDIVPRHSVYYIVPKHPSKINELCHYLNSKTARRWLEANSQRAANGFLRLQSTILKQLPLPPQLAQNTDPKTGIPRARSRSTFN